MQVIGGDESGDICAHVAHHSAAVHACIPIPVLGQSLAMVYLRWHPESAEAAHAGRTPVPFHTKAIAAFAKQVGLALTNLRLKEILRTQAMHDPLTGLYNRRFLEDAFNRELLRAARNQIPVSVLMLDLDHFKIFNDEHGHAAGDALLQAVAVGLRGAIRAEDIACRFGGEEFVVVMADTSLEDARTRAEQVRKSVREVFIDFQGRRLGGITISAGIAVSPDHGEAPDALLHAADLALYAAKAGGRDRTRLAAQIVESARLGRSSSAQARDETRSEVSR
ncbi:MAG: GGDEF domain-containing protein [Deltaproteobacteria bacterium]|nr:GGDEF domain-containing protein [Deltaproteobacteria bacterium]MBW2537201.1 GGDEF domain-containing protein [Deltaproteobacteria bacterium]